MFNFSCDGFNILDQAKDEFETTNKEAFYFKNSRPQLNNYMAQARLSF